MGWPSVVLLLLLGAASPAAGITVLTSGSNAVTNTNVNNVTIWTAGAPPAGSTIVVVIAIKTTTASVFQVYDTSSSTGSYFTKRAAISNGTNSRVEIWSTAGSGAKSGITKITASLTGALSDFTVSAAAYSGVESIGNTATATAATVSVAIQEANNYVVAGFAGAGSTLPTQSSGTLEQASVANNTVGGALTDATSGTAGASVVNAVNIGGEATAAAAVELRTVPGTAYMGTNNALAGYSGSSTGCTIAAGGGGLANAPGVTRVVIVGTTPATAVSSITDGASTYAQRVVKVNGTIRVELWTATLASGASASVTVTLPTSAKRVCGVAEYAGVAALGATTTANGSASPASISLTTQDPRNIVVAGFVTSQGSVNPTISVGNLRGASRTSGGGANESGAITDGFSETTGTAVQNSVAYAAAGSWAAVALELRAPRWSWRYTTGAANMAPPALDPWNNIVVAGSNDSDLHIMDELDGAREFTPFSGPALPIPARAAVIPSSYSTTGVNVAYFGSQDGYVYAVNTATNAQLWKSALLPTTGGMVQGGVSVALKNGGFPSLTNDLVFAGTSNVSSDANYKTNNKLYALNGDDGTAVWTFNATGNNTVDIISSAPYVDFVNSAVWVTSRSNANAQPSVWKLDIATGNVLARWSKTQSGAALGDIDSAPIGSADGSVVYVGTNGGTINAIKAGSSYTGLDPAGSIVTYTPVSTAPCNCTGAGTVKMPWWLSFNAITAGTPDTIIFSRNATVHSVNFNGTTFTPNWTVTPTGSPTSVSGPVDDGVNTYIYIGASDGKVHQLQTSDGTDTKQLPVAAATPTLGDPTFNVDRNLLYVGATDGRVYTFTVPLP